MEERDLFFKATRDIDMILILEDKAKDFSNADRKTVIRCIFIDLRIRILVIQQKLNYFHENRIIILKWSRG